MQAMQAQKNTQKFQNVLICDPEVNVSGFFYFIFWRTFLMNVECLGLQHWVQAQSSGS